MKKTILTSTLALIFAIGIYTFFSESGMASENTTAVVYVYSNAPNAAGSWCNLSNGSTGTFSTDLSGTKKLTLGEGTYSICVYGTGGGSNGIKIDSEETRELYCNNGASCPECPF